MRIFPPGHKKSRSLFKSGSNLMAETTETTQVSGSWGRKKSATPAPRRILRVGIRICSGHIMQIPCLKLNSDIGVGQLGRKKGIRIYISLSFRMTVILLNILIFILFYLA